eukprot:6482597-Amphidinium_carterae.1
MLHTQAAANMLELSTIVDLALGVFIRCGGVMTGDASSGIGTVTGEVRRWENSVTNSPASAARRGELYTIWNLSCHSFARDLGVVVVENSTS